MAIVNVTDDSFYSASRVVTVEAVERRIAEVVEQGATIIDIGGYSSRPGADDIDIETEWARVDLGVGAARRIAPQVAVSVDTFRAEIVRRTVEKYGAIIVNDITAGYGDEQMVELVAELDLPYVAMHMRAEPKTMQSCTDYTDVVGEVFGYLKSRAAELESRGVRRENIILDPGLGFAKSVKQNYQLLERLSDLCDAGYPVLVGLSRKSMIYKLLNTTPEESLAGTVALNWEALRQGAKIVRVHDVAEAVKIVTIYDKGFRNL
ncbi:MAG: dihydropteroate synthase [Alistipes sp.]|nr:dihydropteroate synthase [Alistipes sp.]